MSNIGQATLECDLRASHERVLSGMGLLMLLLTGVLVLSLPYMQILSTDTSYYGHPLNRPAAPFSLHNLQGERVEMAQFKGKFVYLMFGYLDCERVCHTQTHSMFSLRHLLDTDAVVFLYLGMDPQKDTRDRLQHYFATAQGSEGPEFHALLAKETREMQAIANAYRAWYSVKTEGQTTQITHPGQIFLIDPSGNIRLQYQGDQLSTARMLTDFQQLADQRTG